MKIDFPQCWNGVDLYKPDQTHMAYAWNGCPRTHRVALPNITLNILSNVTDAAVLARWRLSSDHYDSNIPAGYSAHADWMNGWKPDIMNTWITKCVQPAVDCLAHLLGDGRQMNDGPADLARGANQPGHSRRMSGLVPCAAITGDSAKSSPRSAWAPRQWIHAFGFSAAAGGSACVAAQTARSRGAYNPYVRSPMTEIYCVGEWLPLWDRVALKVSDWQPNPGGN